MDLVPIARVPIFVLEDDLAVTVITIGTTRPARALTMHWVYLFIAGCLEIVWAFAMKQSHGFTRLGPSIVTLVAMVGSFALLSFAMRSLPLGTAYMIWTGIGAVGAFLAGILFLGESASPARLAAAALIMVGLVLMKLSTPA